MRNLQLDYERFDKDNPHIYPKLLEIARFVKIAGKTRYGIAAIFERLRWISEFKAVGDPYKLNNNHRAIYARRMMNEPEFAGMFSIRKSRVDY